MLNALLPPLQRPGHAVTVPPPAGLSVSGSPSRSEQDSWKTHSGPLPYSTLPHISHRVGEGSDKEHPVDFASSSTQSKMFPFERWPLILAFYKDWDRGHNTNCITRLFTKSLYRRLVAGTMMRKVSSASDGSLFRVKCMGKGADDRGCVGVSWNLRPPVCRLNADPLPGLFPHPRFCSPPGRGSAGLCGWSHRAGRRRHNGLLLWSPDERKHRVGHKELRDNDGVINIPRWMSKFNSSTDPPIHYLIFVTNGLKRICWNGAKSRNTASCVFNFFYSSIYLLRFLSTFELLNQKKRGLNFSNLPLFSLLVCFSLVHTQSRCRCWSEIRRWRKWECRPGPGRFSPPWAS